MDVRDREAGVCETLGVPMTGPTKDQALKFALMIQHGYPSEHAIQYFFPEMVVTQNAEGLSQAHRLWTLSKEVKDAILTVQDGKEWQDLTLDQQIEFALNKNYAELAYFLYSSNYSTMNSTERMKADIARSALESKVAGSAGKLDPLMQWFSDIKSGKVKLGQSVAPIAGSNVTSH